MGDNRQLHLHFDLNDIDREPTDEQLASLMDAVAREARRRSAAAFDAMMLRLDADLAQAIKNAPE